MDKDTIILAIESSCDDTAASIIKNGRIVSNIVSGQPVHGKYGGVIPELAGRKHQQNIVHVVEAALQEAKTSKNQLSAIAFTQGPGLGGSLLVGSSFAKAMALSLKIPLLAVNHLQAHILSNCIQSESENKPIPSFPFLCLTVSGGHTQLVIAKDPLTFELIGETEDDAAGEAFDKGAKMLGLPYPGGPHIDRIAKEGNPHLFKFPIADIKGFNFSFSGLKTALLYFIEEKKRVNPNFLDENLADICASYQYTIVKTLLDKMFACAYKYEIKTLCLAGGVSANSLLRKEFSEGAYKNSFAHYYPSMQYCTDNAAMIAQLAYYMYQAQKFAPLNVRPETRLGLHS